MQRIQETCAATEGGYSLLEELCATTEYFLTRLQMAESVPSAEGRVQFLAPCTAALPGPESWQRDFARACVVLELPPLCSSSSVVPQGGL